MEPGNSPRAVGFRERVETTVEPLIPGATDTTSPRDIILDSAADIGATLGPAARFDANLEAIRLVKFLEVEERRATPVEQAIIAKFSGFGDSAFEDAFSRYASEGSWKRRGDDLREITTPEEYRTIEHSRLNAFFTTPEVTNAIWNGLRQLGIDKIAHPRVLEPAAGSGRFLGFQPADLAARSHRIAVELDQLTGNMLKQTYPQSEVYVMGFEDAPIAEDSIDVAISNVPFGDYPVVDPSFGKKRAFLTRQVHNYFFAKALDKLKPGGVLAFITSHHTMDSTKAQRVRAMWADQADLVGAIRLPKGAFPDTQVVADIVFLQKRLPTEAKGDTSWVNTGPLTLKSTGVEYGRAYSYDTEVEVNQYFLDNPAMVLGEHSLSGSMYRGNEYSVDARTDADLGVLLGQAMEQLPKDVIVPSVLGDDEPRSYAVPTGLNLKEGSRLVNDDGTIAIVRMGVAEPLKLSAVDRERVVQMLAIRDAARALVRLQLEDATDSELAAGREDLNKLYDAFVQRFGALGSRENGNLLKNDPDAPFLRSLEQELVVKEVKDKPLTPGQTEAVKMAIFSERTIRGKRPRIVRTETDALAVSLNEMGRIDFSRMGELLGVSADTVRDSLSETGQVFKNPVGDWEAADKYLSGDVKAKLRTARSAATAVPLYRANVAALEAVQPADLEPSEI
ncbi:hypothetical protein LCGC14_1818470, partial [marine sediment metagenome]